MVQKTAQFGRKVKDSTLVNDKPWSCVGSRTSVAACVETQALYHFLSYYIS